MIKQTERYARQIVLPEIGIEGQEKINNATIAIIGVGALGSGVAELLVRAGIGNVILIDRDIVEHSNLQRQVLFAERDIGISKAKAAQRRLQEINSIIRIKAIVGNFDQDLFGEIRCADVIIDCTDNLFTRLILNDFCKQQKKTWIYGAGIGTKGYVMPMLPQGPCLRCFISEAELATCETAGVLNTLTSQIATSQTTLAFKILLNETIDPYLLYYDVWQNLCRKIIVPPKQDCPTCNGIFEYLSRKQQVTFTKFCSSGRYQLIGKPNDLRKIKKRWETAGKVKDDGDVIALENITLFKDGRALIKADSKEEALAVYSKWIGN